MYTYDIETNNYHNYEWKTASSVIGVSYDRIIKKNKKDRRYSYNTDDKFLTNGEIEEIWRWCVENLGAYNRKTWWCSNTGSFYISDPELAMAFKLRWL